jgi:hypothetical protein
MKRCPKCGDTKPLSAFYARKDRHGQMVQAGYCKECKREAGREWARRPENRERTLAQARARYEASKADPELVSRRRARDRERQRRYRAADPERYRDNNRRWRERMLADPERKTRLLAGRRIYARVARERITGKLEGAWRSETTAEPYRQVAHGKGSELVPAAPIVGYLRRTFPGWKPGEIATHTHNAVSGRLIYRLLVEGSGNVELDAVDRLVTHGLGRPDLLLALYPIEA